MTVSFEKPIKNQRQKVARQNRKHSFYVQLYISFTRTHLFHHIKIKTIITTTHTHNFVGRRADGRKQSVCALSDSKRRCAAVSRAIHVLQIDCISPSLAIRMVYLPVLPAKCYISATSVTTTCVYRLNRSLSVRK